MSSAVDETLLHVDRNNFAGAMLGYQQPVIAADATANVQHIFIDNAENFRISRSSHGPPGDKKPSPHRNSRPHTKLSL